MTYDLNITGRGFVALMQTSNNIVDGWMGVGLLIMFVFIAFTLAKNYPLKIGIMTASFFGMVLSILFRLMGIMSDLAMFGFFFIFLGAIVMNYLIK